MALSLEGDTLIPYSLTKEDRDIEVRVGGFPKWPEFSTAVVYTFCLTAHFYLVLASTMDPFVWFLALVYDWWSCKIWSQSWFIFVSKQRTFADVPFWAFIEKE